MSLLIGWILCFQFDFDWTWYMVCGFAYFADLQMAKERMIKILERVDELEQKLRDRNA